MEGTQVGTEVEGTEVEGTGTEGTGAQQIRLVLVDDQHLVRAGFRMVLDAQADMTVVGEAGDGQEALDLLGRTEADVVLMDIRMPRMDGVRATEEIAARGRSPAWWC